MLVCLDPGTAEAGIAVYENRELVCAWLSRLRPLGKTRGWLLMARQVYRDLMSRYPLEALSGATLAIEVPQIYHGRSVGKDQIKLAQMGAALAGYLASRIEISVKEYLPKQWKGSVKKEAMTDRILERLTPEEISRIEECPASLRHNIVDACGIGLKMSGRLG